MKYIDCPVCNCKMEIIEGFDTICDCGFKYEESSCKPLQNDTLYDEERMKNVRGVPCHKIKIGSESKGHLEINVPIYLRDEEISILIDKMVDKLEYTLNKIEHKGLDIFTNRGKR